MDHEAGLQCWMSEMDKELGIRRSLHSIDGMGYARMQLPEVLRGVWVPLVDSSLHGGGGAEVRYRQRCICWLA